MYMLDLSINFKEKVEKMVISICNEKGGSGKSNIAINMAVKLGLNGDDTLLIDTDPQRTTEVFNVIRTNNKLPLIYNSVAKNGAGLINEIKSLENKYDAIIVDTGGRDSEEMRQALLASNITIIPVIPSDADIAVLNKMIALVNQSRIYNPRLKAFIVISKASPNPFLKQKVNDLKEYIQDKNLEDIFLLDSIIYEREAYKNAFTAGKGVLEFCTISDKAYEDFSSFFDEVVRIANGQ